VRMCSGGHEVGRGAEPMCACARAGMRWAEGGAAGAQGGAGCAEGRPSQTAGQAAGGGTKGPMSTQARLQEEAPKGP